VITLNGQAIFSGRACQLLVADIHDPKSNVREYDDGVGRNGQVSNADRPYNDDNHTSVVALLP
jgi:hypothetical protein